MGAWEEVAQTAVVFAGSAATLVGARRSRTHQMREEIRSNLELLAELPEASSTRGSLLRSIDKQVELLIEEARKSRDPMGLVLAIFLLGVAVWMGYFAVQDDGLSPWWIGVFVFGLFGLIGLGSEAKAKSAEERERAKAEREARRAGRKRPG